MRLSGNNSFSDGVALNAGTLIIANNNALGTGTLTAGGGTLAADNNGPYVVNNAVSLSSTLTVSGGGSFTLAGTISGSGGLTKAGSGTLTLSGIESFTGPISINGGTLAMNTSLASNVTNSATFVYNSGTFGGRLTNLGTVVLNADFTAGNGMENDGNFALATGRTVTLNGAGLDNEGTFAMTGGTLNVNPAGGNVNRGNFNLSANLGLGTATLTNSGTFALSGGLVSGASGTLTNTFGGIVSGAGTIQCGFSNGGGTLIIGGGSINITAAFSNAGLIQLTAINSNLVGGTITNSVTGSMQGLGVVGNAVANNGTIRALGGILSVSGSLTNLANGMLSAGSGSELFATGGLATNHGVVNLTGGIFDNDGNPLNNAVNGQISGWGTFATGGTGLDNHGSISFTGGLTTVNGPVTNENGQMIVVAYSPAIFTGLVTNNGGGAFNIISTTATFAGGSNGAFGGTFTNNANSAFSEGGNGTLEVDGAPTLNSGSSLAVNDTSTLRFKATSGAATIGTGVTAMVDDGATLELEGSVSALSNGPNCVNITNNSSAAAGILVSGTHQVVSNIDGSGTTQVNAGSDLTANHIVQSALVIGGTLGSPALVTIDASDVSGNPLGQSSGLALASSLTPSNPFGTLGMSSTNLSTAASDSADLAVLATGKPIGSNNPAPVPEPSTLRLALLGVLGLVSTLFVRHHVRCQTV
jgi:autotransporter-associated beta strand protein